MSGAPRASRSGASAGWRRRASRVGFECPWFRVRVDEVELPSGEAITYNVVEHAGWAMVVPLLPDGRVVMERVYRYTLDAWTLECPSGGLDGDAPETAARRELEEETGYLASDLVQLGHFAASDGYTNERYDVFLARDVAAGGRIAREPTELIEVELHDLDVLRRMALAGEIEDGPSALAILLAAERVASERAGARAGGAE